MARHHRRIRGWLYRPLDNPGITRFDNPNSLVLLGWETTDPYLRLARPLTRQSTRPTEQSRARFSKETSSVVISYSRWGWCLLDDDFTCHFRMDGTEVRVSSCGREGVREALSRLQYR